MDELDRSDRVDEVGDVVAAEAVDEVDEVNVELLCSNSEDEEDGREGGRGGTEERGGMFEKDSETLLRGDTRGNTSDGEGSSADNEGNSANLATNRPKLRSRLCTTVNPIFTEYSASSDMYCILSILVREYSLSVWNEIHGIVKKKSYKKIY